MPRFAFAASALALAFAGATALVAQDARAAEAQAEVKTADGQVLGLVEALETASGQVLVTISLSNVPAGVHAAHFHETGDCSAPDFTSAGGHIAGDAQHGIMAEGGPHPGDLPNVTVQDDGAAQLQFFNPRIELETHLLDEDGAAFVLHAGADDYESQPSGDAGGRIACGVFAKVD